MWFLQGAEARYALPLGTVMVGRGVPPGPHGIVLSDLTISRLHGSLAIEAPGKARERPSPDTVTVQLTDASTAGSFVNEEPVRKTTVRLAAGDSVRFGGPTSPTFKLVWVDFALTLASKRLDEDGKLAEAALKAGLGRFVSPGPGKPRPTHCVSGPELTPKSPLLLALLEGSQIVTVEWLRRAVDPGRLAGEWPAEASHRPRPAATAAAAGASPAVQEVLEKVNLDALLAAPPLDTSLHGVYIAFASVASAFYSHVFSLATDKAGEAPPFTLLPPPAVAAAAAAREGGEAAAFGPDVWLPAAAAEHGPMWSEARQTGQPLGRGVAGLLVASVAPLSPEAAAAADKLITKHGFLAINELELLSLVAGLQTAPALVAAVQARQAAEAAAAVAAAAAAAKQQEEEEEDDVEVEEESVEAPPPPQAVPPQRPPTATAAGALSQRAEWQGAGSSHHHRNDGPAAAPDEALDAASEALVRPGGWMDLSGRHASYSARRRSTAPGGQAPPLPAAAPAAAAAAAAAEEEGGKRTRRPRAATASSSSASAGGFDISAADMEEDATVATGEAGATSSSSGHDPALEAYLRSHEAEAYRVVDDVAVTLPPQAQPARKGSSRVAPPSAVPTFQRAVPSGMERYYNGSGRGDSPSDGVAGGLPNVKRFRKVLPVVWQVAADAVGVQDKALAVPILAGNEDVAAALAQVTAADAAVDAEETGMFAVAEYAALAGKKRLAAAEKAGVAKLGELDDVEGGVNEKLAALTGGLLEADAAALTHRGGRIGGAAAAASSRSSAPPSAKASDDEGFGSDGDVLGAAAAAPPVPPPPAKRPRLDAPAPAPPPAARTAAVSDEDDDGDILEVVTTSGPSGRSGGGAPPPPPPPPPPPAAGKPVTSGRDILNRVRAQVHK